MDKFQYQLDLFVALESAKQLTEYKKNKGYDPKEIFLDENVQIFHEPDWDDVLNLYCNKMLSDSIDALKTVDQRTEEEK